jgi:hypothetical protein
VWPSSASITVLSSTTIMASTSHLTTSNCELPTYLSAFLATY